MAVFTHPISFVKEAAPFLYLCWKMGWNEANGGNFSWRLPTDEVKGILARHYPELQPGPGVSMPLDEPDLDGEYFLVTGSGQFFRHAIEHPNQVFGIVQIVDGGRAWRQVWGFSSGAKPTSEFATHLVAHAVRKRVSDGRERMILHAHLPEFIALSFLEPLDSRADIYSFGCLIFEIVSGKLPYTGASSDDLLQRHLKSPVPSLIWIS